MSAIFAADQSQRKLLSHQQEGSDVPHSKGGRCTWGLSTDPCCLRRAWLLSTTFEASLTRAPSCA